MELLTDQGSRPREPKMLDQIRKLVKHSVVYGLGLMGYSITIMVLTPMFLHRLNRAEYGMMDVLNVFTSMLYNVLLLGVASVLIKIYINDCKDERERKLLIGSMVVFTGIMAGLITSFAYIFAKPLAVLLFKDERYALLVVLAAGGSGMLLVQQMTMLCLRAKQWPAKFAAVSLSQLAVIIALNFYLVWSRNLGVLGVQLAAISAYAVSVIVGLFLIRADLLVQFSRGWVKRVLILSIPLVPASLAPWVLNMSNRYFLNYFWGLDTTGLYAVGYKVGMLGIVILVNAFQLAWSPLFFANSDDKDTPRLCANVLKHYVVVLVVGGLTLSVFAPEILRVIARREYWAAASLVPYVALAYVFYGAQFYAVPMFIRMNRGKWLSVIMCSVAVTNVTLNLILIPRYGIPGAIAATMATFSVLAVLTLGMANRIYPVPYQYMNFVKTLVSAAAVYLVFRHVAVTSAPTFILKSAALPIFGLLLLAARFFSRREMELMQSIPGRVARRFRP